MSKYHKIDGLWERDPITKKLVPGVFRSREVEFLKDCAWEFTEKIDGTNIRVIWDGYRVTFGGRTEKAIIPPPLLEVLETQFGGRANEEIFEQSFGNKEVVLYGEGYGGNIQKGTNYRNDHSFILFDVKINDTFVSRDAVTEIATYFGVDTVPVVCVGTIENGVNYVKSKPHSTIGSAMMEGVVGRPAVELLGRGGNRVIVKIKVCDFEEE